MGFFLGWCRDWQSGRERWLGFGGWGLGWLGFDDRDFDGMSACRTGFERWKHFDGRGFDGRSFDGRGFDGRQFLGLGWEREQVWREVFDDGA